MKSYIKFLVTVGLFSTLLLVGSEKASAITEYPHPTYKDTWEYGVTSTNWAYSNYYLEAPAHTRLGSRATVTDFWGNIKSRAEANYGWAYAGAVKEWTWVQAKAFYGWYNF
ncbi:bacteriocin, lactococcin 972 family protein [Streptococcus marmotae]|uniref:bacteriocin, lactococcin 972 family protein n=1 Tax=Streptococcus marmotae TaxID=1825069 RepID=UPI00082EEEDA|nr:bacteriocin, lactococcin 972 family protein [Streptococcus marmotae]